MRVLFLTHRLPYAPNRGDRIRAYHMLKSISAYAAVDLVSLTHTPEEEHHARDLDFLASVNTAAVPRARNLARGFFSLPTRRPLTHALLDAPALTDLLKRLTSSQPPDVVLVYCSGMARFALEFPLCAFPVVLDMVDMDSAKWAGLADVSRWPLRHVYRREARCVAEFERRAVMAAKATLVVNEREQVDLTTATHGSNIRVIPNGVDVERFARPAQMTREPIVVFTGVMDYAPNEQGAIWLAKKVWPVVRRLKPNARLLLVGSNPTKHLRHLVVEDGSIQVTGTVPDVRPYLWRAAVAVAPLHTSRGLQNKVLEAVAAGLPCVVTPGVRAGLPDEVIAACDIADDPLEFANRLLRLLDLTDDARKSLVQAADVKALRWESRLLPLHEILSTASLSAKN